MTNADPGTNTPPSSAEDAGTRDQVLHVRISGKTIWQTIGAILATLVLLWAFNQARGVVSMVAISFFFSLALDPGVRRLTQRFGWRRGAAVGVIYLLGFLFVAFMIVILIPAIAELARAIGDRGADWLTEVSDFTEDTFGWSISEIDSAQDLAASFDGELSDFAEGAFGQIIGIASSGLGFVFSLATIAMFTFYFTADAPNVQRAVLRLFSGETQQRVGWTWDQAIIQTGGYFYSRVILMVINGIGFFFTMVLVGMPVALALSLSLVGAFISVFIPAIGTYIGGAIPVLVTLGIQGLTAALIVLGYVLVYQQLENYWLSPKISSDTMTLNGGVAFGAALAGGTIAGPMGAFTALPIAALISSFISNYVASHDVVYESRREEQQEARRADKRRNKKAKKEPSASGSAD